MSVFGGLGSCDGAAPIRQCDAVGSPSGGKNGCAAVVHHLDTERTTAGKGKVRGETVAGVLPLYASAVAGIQFGILVLGCVLLHQQGLGARSRVDREQCDTVSADSSHG